MRARQPAPVCRRATRISCVQRARPRVSPAVPRPGRPRFPRSRRSGTRDWATDCTALGEGGTFDSRLLSCLEVAALEPSSENCARAASPRLPARLRRALPGPMILLHFFFSRSRPRARRRMNMRIAMSDENPVTDAVTPACGDRTPERNGIVFERSGGRRESGRRPPPATAEEFPSRRPARLASHEA